MEISWKKDCEEDEKVVKQKNVIKMARIR